MTNERPPTSDYRRKRQRLTRACDLCRAKKVRCDEGQPACSRCAAAGAKCATTDAWGRSVPSDTRRKTRSTSDVDTEQQQRLATSGSGLPPGLAEPSWSPNAFNGRPTPPRSQSASHSNRPLIASPSDLPVDQSNSDLPPVFAIEDAVAMNRDDSTTRQQYIGSSSLQIMAQWLDLTFAIYGGNPSFSSGFRHGMRHAVEFDLPLATLLPDILASELAESAIAIYFAKTNVIFPALNQQDFRNKSKHLLGKRNLAQSQDIDRPLLATLYAVLSIGSDEIAGAVTETGTQYLQAAYLLLPHLIARPYMSSVQALLLITLVLMNRNKEGTAYQILGSAVRMSQALGLHRRNRSQDKADGSTDLQPLRVWWIVYCLDKKLTFESGRPSTVLDDDIDVPLPDPSNPTMSVLASLVGLAQIESQVSTKLYHGSHRRLSVDETFATIVEIDKTLLRWLESVPEEVRPSADTIHFSPEFSFVAIYLSFNYHQVMITLHRQALLFEDQIFKRQLERAASRTHVSPRLKAGESICVSSARSMITMMNDAVQQNVYTSLCSLTQPLMAVYCLAINVIKHPWSWSAPSDLKLIESTSKLVGKLYLKAGQHPAFSAMLQDLEHMANQVVTHATESKRMTNLDPVRQQIDTGFSDVDPFADDGFATFLNQDPVQQGTAEEIGNLLGLQFVGDDFGFVTS